MTTRTAFLLALLIPAAPALAAGRQEVGLNFALGFPQGDFGEHVDNIGWGGIGHYGYTLPGAPLMIGADLGYMLYGHESRREPFSTTIPDVTVKVSTSNNIFLAHFLLRLAPTWGVLRPHIDGLVGLKHLFTETSIKNEDDDDGDPIAQSTNWEDSAWSYGVGAGLQVQVLTAGDMTQEGVHLREVLVTGGARYLFGSEADYLKKGSIRRTPEGRAEYDLQTSRTDLLIAYVGATVAF